jgi:hypothetical protein
MSAKEQIGSVMTINNCKNGRVRHLFIQQLNYVLFPGLSLKKYCKDGRFGFTTCYFI